MSLDLYITSKTPIRKRGTGVYVRDNFETAGSPGYREHVLKGYLYLRTHKEEILPLNPDNGWGNYDQLLAFTLDFLLHLIAADDDFEIYASR